MSNFGANPKFSYSYTREKGFNKCKRWYYYYYYGSHLGWEKDANKESVLAYRYKNVSSLEKRFKEYVKKSIKYVIMNPDKKERMIPYIKECLKRDCVMALNQEAWKKFPKKNPSLVEVLNYEDKFKNPEVKKISSEINDKLTKLENIFKSKMFKELSSAKIIELYESIKSSDMCRFILKVNGKPLTIYSGVDCVYELDGKYIITRWETENSFINESVEDNKYFLLLLQTLYVYERYNIDFSNILVRVVDVFTGESKEYTFTKEQVRKCVNRILYGVRGMAAYVEGNLTENKAKSKDSFPMQKDDSCRSCQYYRICRGDDRG